MQPYCLSLENSVLINYCQFEPFLVTQSHNFVLMLPLNCDDTTLLLICLLSIVFSRMWLYLFVQNKYTRRQEWIEHISFLFSAKYCTLSKKIEDPIFFEHLNFFCLPISILEVSNNLLIMLFCFNHHLFVLVVCCTSSWRENWREAFKIYILL